MKVDKKSIRKILIIQLRAIGDVVLTTPVISVLKRHFPLAKIHFLTSGAIAPILNGHPELDKVISHNFPPSSIIGFYKTSKVIQCEKYDLVIDYQVSPGTARITEKSGAKYRLGWDMHRNRSAYNLISDANKKDLYVPVQKCMALREIGIDEIFTRTKISVPDESIAKVENYFESLGLSSQSFKINISPIGKRQAREWDVGKIKVLSEILVKNYNATVFYNCMPDELPLVKNLLPDAGDSIHPLPSWDLSTFSAYLSLVNLHISYDNGPKHLAIAGGTPTIALFATDPPVLWNPLSEENHPHILTSANCRLCGLRQCDLKICMKAIQPEDIIAEMIKIPKLKEKIA